MKKRHVLIITFSALILLAGLTACRHGRHPGGFDEFDLEAATNRIASRLDLSESQKAMLSDSIAEVAARAEEMRADHESRHQEVVNLVRQEAIDPDTAERMLAEKFSRMQELADLALNRFIAFHATLTPEQREALALHMEEHVAAHRCFFRR